MTGPVRSAMSVEAACGARSAHVVVLGNEKGGSGKSTTAMHVAVALLKAGQRVATIDLDFAAEELHPLHREPPRLGQARPARSRIAVALLRRARRRRCWLDENEAIEFNGFAAAIDAVEHTHDFIVIDTPGHDSYLMRLAHSMADTLITPLNDSFVDFDVLGTVDPATFAVTGDQPLRRDGARRAPPAPRGRSARTIDWIVVRNRLSMLGSRNKRLVGEGLAGAVAAARLPRRRRLRRARDLSASSFRAG